MPKTLTWSRVTEPPAPKCGVRRGGGRSKVFCEKPPGHGQLHIGRSSTGRWFCWYG